MSLGEKILKLSNLSLLYVLEIIGLLILFRLSLEDLASELASSKVILFATLNSTSFCIKSINSLYIFFSRLISNFMFHQQIQKKCKEKSPLSKKNKLIIS